MQIEWKCLIFTGAENNTTAHGKAQLVLRLIATIKGEWLEGLGASQAQTKQHQAVSPLPHSHPAPVLLFPANYAVNSHPTINSASNDRLHRSAYKITAWAPARFVTAQIASRIEEGTIWEEEQMLGYLIGAFSKTGYSQD